MVQVITIVWGRRSHFLGHEASFKGVVSHRVFLVVRPGRCARIMGEFRGRNVTVGSHGRVTRLTGRCVTRFSTTCMPGGRQVRQVVTCKGGDLRRERVTPRAVVSGYIQTVCRIILGRGVAINSRTSYVLGGVRGLSHRESLLPFEHCSP